MSGKLFYREEKNYKAIPDIKYFEKDGRILKCHLNYFTYGTSSCIRGYLIEIHDDTEQQNHIKELNEMARKAESASMAKSSFLASISHEIRTPINAVMGMNELIVRETKEARTRVYAQTAKKAGNSLLTIINNILDYSRIESGNQKLQSVKFKTEQMIQEVLNITKMKLQEKNVEFQIDIDENIPARLLGDDARISQILLNLLSNAVKYTEEGFIKLSMKLINENEDIARILICVEDTGIGIRKEDIGQLTQVFKRVDENRNRNIEGTGLGLAIVASLLNLMNSEIKIESEYGKGSCFSFELLLRKVDDQRIGKFVIFDEEEDEINYKAGFIAPKAEILVVDDNQTNLFIFVGLLKGLKVKITTASNGFEALQMVKEKRFDLIFMDHLMPELDGIQTLRKMKKMVGNVSKDAKVIAVTANAYTGAKELYIKKGFDDFIEKPIDGKVLEGMIQTYLPDDLIVDTEEIDMKEEGNQENSEKQNNDSQEIEKLLEKARIDVIKGLSYANNKWDFYIEILRCFVQEFETKKRILSNWDEDHLIDFINVSHQLKGELRGIGASDLGEVFFKLEMAGKERSVEKIHALLPKAIIQLDELIEQLKSIFKD